MPNTNNPNIVLLIEEEPDAMLGSPYNLNPSSSSSSSILELHEKNLFLCLNEVRKVISQEEEESESHFPHNNNGNNNNENDDKVDYDNTILIVPGRNKDLINDIRNQLKSSSNHHQTYFISIPSLLKDLSSLPHILPRDKPTQTSLILRLLKAKFYQKLKNLKNKKNLIFIIQLEDEEFSLISSDDVKNLFKKEKVGEIIILSDPDDGESWNFLREKFGVLKSPNVPNKSPPPPESSEPEIDIEWPSLVLDENANKSKSSSLISPPFTNSEEEQEELQEEDQDHTHTHTHLNENTPDLKRRKRKLIKKRRSRRKAKNASAPKSSKNNNDIGTGPGPGGSSSSSTSSASGFVVHHQSQKLFKIVVTPQDESQYPSSIFTYPYPPPPTAYQPNKDSAINLYKGWVAVPAPPTTNKDTKQKTFRLKSLKTFLKNLVTCNLHFCRKTSNKKSKKSEKIPSLINTNRFEYPNLMLKYSAFDENQKHKRS